MEMKPGDYIAKHFTEDQKASMRYWMKHKEIRAWIKTPVGTIGRPA